MEEETITTFGKALRAERERMGLTQKELADRVGTVQQSVGGWEAGRSLPRPEMFDKLVEVFGPHSPVAALPPRGQIVQRAKYGPSPMRPFKEINESRIKRELDARLARAVEEPVRVYPHQEAAIDGLMSGPVVQSLDSRFANARRATAIRRAHLRDTLRDLLPEELHRHMEARIPAHHLQARADYISDRLCLEIIRSGFGSGRSPAEALNVQSARLGMQRLLVSRALLRMCYPTDERTYLLVLLTADDDGPEAARVENTGARNRAPVFFDSSAGEARALSAVFHEAGLLDLEIQLAGGVADIAAAIEQIERGDGEPPGAIEDYEGYGEF